MVEGTNLHRPLSLAMALLIFSGSAISADTAAGTVKKTTGHVSIERAGSVVSVQVGTLIMAHDKIITGADGVVGVTLKDDTRLSAGSNSVLSLDRFTFNATTYEGNFSLQILKGTLRAITGLIARQSPGSVKFSTPTATIGIRGTDFIVDVPSND